MLSKIRELCHDLKIAYGVKGLSSYVHFQELFELAQRKLLRQLALYAENQDTDVYPRLFVADFLKDETKEPAGEPCTVLTV